MDPRPKCQYGLGCYRNNPAHFTEYAHPGHPKNVPPPARSAPPSPAPVAPPAAPAVAVAAGGAASVCVRLCARAVCVRACICVVCQRCAPRVCLLYYTHITQTNAWFDLLLPADPWDQYLV